jgi:hypothetical protein
MARARAAKQIVVRRAPAPKVQVVRVGPSRASKVKRGVSRGMSAAAKSAMTEKHTITALAGAAALGIAKRQGIELPKVEQLGTAGTYGAGAYLAARFTKSKTLAHLATGLLSVALYELAAGDSITGEDIW